MEHMNTDLTTVTAETIPLRWYHYRQNNSGGSFEGPVDVYVQATSPEEADRLAVDSGLVYFDDEYTIDCGCCGTRWSQASDYAEVTDQLPEGWDTKPEWLGGSGAATVALDGTVTKVWGK